MNKVKKKVIVSASSDVVKKKLKRLLAVVADKQKLEDHLSFKHENEAIHLVIDPQKLTSRDLSATLTSELLKLENIVVDFKSFASVCKLEPSSLALVLASAVEFANHEHAFCLKTKKPVVKKHTLEVKKEHASLVLEAEVVARAQTQTRRWQEMPSNYLNPETFVVEIKKMFAPLKNVKVKVLNHQDLLAKKMGLICGVAQGGEHGGFIVGLEYNTNSKAKKLALVGKGVCFDTGGYSLKVSGSMRGMKYDMSGAAAVVNAVYALAVNKINANVVGVVGLVENLISLKSYRVDDILTSYQGTTVEVDNTDAEGRLVLADCLTYAYKDLKADKLLSIATLTGAIIIALGSTFAGGWATSDADWNQLATAANLAGDGLWRMPFHNDYFKLLKSRVADLKNSTNSRLAGSSRAACFLKHFTNNLPYFHIDIAGMDSVSSDGSAQGPFVRALYCLAKQGV